MFETNLIRIQFNQILYSKEALGRRIPRGGGSRMLLERWLRTDWYQLYEVVLVNKTLTDANNEIGKRL